MPYTHTPPSEPKPGCRAERHGFGRRMAASLRAESRWGGYWPFSRCGRNAWPALCAAKRNRPRPLTAADSTRAGQGVCEVPALRGVSKLDENSHAPPRAPPTRLPGCPRDHGISGGDGPGPVEGRRASSSRKRFRACTTVTSTRPFVRFACIADAADGGYRSGERAPRMSVRSLHGISCDIRSARVRCVLCEVFAAIQRQPREWVRLCSMLRAGISSPVETAKQRDGCRLGRGHWLRDSTSWRAWPRSAASAQCARGNGSSLPVRRARVAPG